MSDLRVVALLGTGVVPAETPILRADDLGALRGDGVFESMHVRGGRAWLLREHLARMRRSATLMGLDLPAEDRLIELAEQALGAWPESVEGALRLICTRGREHPGGSVTVFATISAVSEEVRRLRHDGIAVRTASLGVPADLRQRAPWLLGGAKTLSYALNMASQRWAQSVGADDVLWVSGDGYALEAPTSTLVWLDGSALCTVPADQTGILAGTTAQWLLDHAGEFGWTAAQRMVTPAELAGCAGAWLVSSVRGIVAIRTLDEAHLSWSAQTTARMRGLLGFD